MRRTAPTHREQIRASMGVFGNGKRDAYDPMRKDKKALPKPSDEEMFFATCKVARKMLKDFSWKDWMGQFINQDGSERPYQKGIVT